MHSKNPSISRRCSPADPDTGGRSLPPAFQLDGPTRALDARINAFRPDIADIALAGTLFASHYAAPMLRAATASAIIHSAASDEAEASSQLLQGEEFAILDVANGWAWGYSSHDHYVGYIRADRLGMPFKPSHQIAVREALVFAGPSIKSPTIATLPFGARIAGERRELFVETAAGFVHNRHVVPWGTRADDPVTIAEMFLGMPYLWGGRGAGGIDCSGLVQIALGATGILAPRDTDMQRENLGASLPGEARLRRGDIISFPGHVGLMVDEQQVVHANAHWMSVSIEPLADVVARLTPLHERPILSRRRLPS